MSGTYEGTRANNSSYTGLPWNAASVVNFHPAPGARDMQLAWNYGTENRFAMRKQRDTENGDWNYPWCELWHSENFNPEDYALSIHANKHFIDGSDPIIATQHYGLYDITSSDPWYVDLSYGGLGIGSNNGTNRQMIAFTDGSTNNNVFSQI